MVTLTNSNVRGALTNVDSSEVGDRLKHFKFFEAIYSRHQRESNVFYLEIIIQINIFEFVRMQIFVLYPIVIPISK